jgi:hypothetical protein
LRLGGPLSEIVDEQKRKKKGKTRTFLLFATSQKAKRGLKIQNWSSFPNFLALYRGNLSKGFLKEPDNPIRIDSEH